MWYIIPKVHKVGEITNVWRAWSQSGGQVQHCNMQPDWTGCYSVETIKDCRFLESQFNLLRKQGVFLQTPERGNRKGLNGILMSCTLFFLFFFTLSGLQYHRHVHRVAHARRPPEDFGRKHPGEDFLPV